jgi:hypothetical protein
MPRSRGAALGVRILAESEGEGAPPPRGLPPSAPRKAQPPRGRLGFILWGLLKSLTKTGSGLLLCCAPYSVSSCQFYRPLSTALTPAASAQPCSAPTSATYCLLLPAASPLPAASRSARTPDATSAARPLLGPPMASAARSKPETRPLPRERVAAAPLTSPASSWAPVVLVVVWWGWCWGGGGWRRVRAGVWCGPPTRR